MLGKCRKNVIGVTPAACAISATVVASKPRRSNRSSATDWRRAWVRSRFEGVDEPGTTECYSITFSTVGPPASLGPGLALAILSTRSELMRASPVLKDSDLPRGIVAP